MLEMHVRVRLGLGHDVGLEGLHQVVAGIRGGSENDGLVVVRFHDSCFHYRVLDLEQLVVLR